LIDAGDATFDAYAAAFPNSLLSIAIGAILNPVLAPNGEHYVNDTVIAHARAAYPNRIFCTKNAMNARAPFAPGSGEWLHIWNSRPNAIQQLSRCFNDPTHRMGPGTPDENFIGCIDRCVSYEAFWFEAYEIDCANLDPATIHYAHQQLNP